MQKALHSKSAVVNIFIAEANHMNCQLVATAFRRKRYRVAVVGSAVNSSLAISLVKEREPDVAIVSAQLEAGPLEGFGVVRDMRALQSRTRAVMLLASRERELVVGAFRCGAHGVIFRDEPFETLCKCIHAVHRGQVWANSEHLGYVLQALNPTVPLHLQDSNGVALLSKREEEVVRLVSEGMTNKQISSHLRLSEHTIRNYLFHVSTSSESRHAWSWFSTACRKDKKTRRPLLPWRPSRQSRRGCFSCSWLGRRGPARRGASWMMIRGNAG